MNTPPDDDQQVLRINRQAWDDLVSRRQRHTLPVKDQDLVDPLKKIDAAGWYGSVEGKRVLCLGAGGGYQSALFAAAGASVTVLDISPAMLVLDRQVAEKYGFRIEAVEGSMDNLAMLPEAGFDLVAQPVSTCYVNDIVKVYREVARVVAPGGLYVSQHKQPVSMQAGIEWDGRGYALIEPYYRNGPLPEVRGSKHREPGTIEFLHRWHDMLGGLCRSGFVIEDLREPYHGGQGPQTPGSYPHRCRWVPPYVRIKARRTDAPAPGHTLWTP